MVRETEPNLIHLLCLIKDNSKIEEPLPSDDIHTRNGEMLNHGSTRIEEVDSLFGYVESN